ncbi:MAG: glucosamine-6-phosphate isomerase [Planctomycetes bacterium]|nr:glucosamine-6-phosphate isomerase [Planctomycetota bacterium]
MDLLSTLSGSLLEGFFPKGWDLARFDRLAALPPAEAVARRPHWHERFEAIPCADLPEFEVRLGHEIALEVRAARDAGRELVLILPVGPMGMYRWIVFFLREWGVGCGHVHGFNMDEWADAQGNTLPGDRPGSFQQAMEAAFYGPLGDGTVPPAQRFFATRELLPSYAERIDAIRKRGGKLVVVYGVGRVCHIAFWEPHFAAEFADPKEWAAQTHRLGAKLHPLTIEQNAITSFRSRTTLVPCFANTIGPGLFLRADRGIGGCDGTLGRGMQWQGLSFRATLGYGPDPWVPSSHMPAIPGRLFYLQELADPLEPECN